MALNYPRLDNASGVWNIKEVTDAVLGGYWPNAGARALWMGGTGSPGFLDEIDYVTISSTGDAADFGNLIQGRSSPGRGSGTGNFTRGFMWGGYFPDAYQDEIQYVTIMTTGNAADFGDLSVARQMCGGSSNSTRAIAFGGAASGHTASNVIDYIQMASVGNATDFGNTSVARIDNVTMASPTRYVGAGGNTPSNTNVIDYIEFATTGNAVDFGDLTQSTKGYAAGFSSATRGVFAGGKDSPTSFFDRVEYIEIASTGNSIDYGDLTAARGNPGGTSGGSRGIVGGGRSDADTNTNIIEYFAIPSGGKTVDFGNLVSSKYALATASNAHGGLNDGYQGTRINPIPQGSGAGTRGLWAGGQTPVILSNIDVVTITTLGNAADFGDLSQGRYGALNGGMTSSVRGCFGAGYVPGSGQVNIIDYIHFAHTGNAADFGNLTVAKSEHAQGSNETRGIAFAGYKNQPNPNTEDISYITIATIGDAADFGDASVENYGPSCVTSTTRLVAMLGSTPSNVNTMEYLTIGSTGDATDFGDSSVTRQYAAANISSTTRGCFGGGEPQSNVIDYITIASTGDASDFGDLTVARYKASGVSTVTRGVMAGGFTPAKNEIDYITIASTGDAADFGDLTTVNYGPFSGSNGHGGLS